MNSVIENFKKAGLLSKNLSERIMSKTDLVSTQEAPPSINPDLPQSDINISGHTNLETPLVDMKPSSKDDEPKKDIVEPKDESTSEPTKTEKDYLFNSLSSALSVVEACTEMLVDAKCFETVDISQDSAQAMQEMLGKIKEWKGKVSEWAEENASEPAPSEAQPQNSLPVQSAVSPEQVAPSQPASQPASQPVSQPTGDVQQA